MGRFFCQTSFAPFHARGMKSNAEGRCRSLWLFADAPFLTVVGSPHLPRILKISAEISFQTGAGVEMFL